MLRTRILRLIRTNSRIHRPLSTIQPSTVKTENDNKQLRNIDDLFKSGNRPIIPLTEHPAIVKNFFISEVDSEQMLYPEVISKDELDKLIELNDRVSECIDTNVEFDSKGISKSTHDTFKQNGLYGYNVPKEFGGSGYTYTEMILASEAEARNVCVAIPLNAHRLVCEAINEFGTAKQRSNLLPKLAEGELVATTAFQELSKVDTSTAEYDTEKKQWRLNGNKSFVVNASKTNLFMVTAQTPQSEEIDPLTIFLVDSNLPGVLVHKKDITLGHNDVYQADVSFKDVYLPSDAILSAPGSGRHIERTTMFLSRLQIGALNLIQMKAISKYMLDMVDSAEQQNRILNPEGASFEESALRVEVSKSSCSVYAVESMIYMVAGLMDLYKNTNIDVETAILKTYSQDMLSSMAMNLSSFVDTPATVAEHPINSLIRDAVQLQTFGEPKDILKLYIGIAGIQHSGERIFEDVKKKRNPFLNPEYALESFFKADSMDKYESNLQLMEHVVSPFDTQAKWLESSIHKLRIGCNALMTAHGRNLLKNHGEIQRLGETATYIFASFACLIRANRSWILKLPGAVQERVLSGVCCDTFTKQIKEHLESIDDGPNDPVEQQYSTIAKQLIKTKSYFPVHPLTRFF